MSRRTVVIVILAVVLAGDLALLGLATNLLSARTSLPGKLDLIRQHTAFAFAIFTAVGLVASAAAAWLQLPAHSGTPPSQPGGQPQPVVAPIFNVHFAQSAADAQGPTESEAPGEPISSGVEPGGGTATTSPTPVSTQQSASPAEPIDPVPATSSEPVALYWISSWLSNGPWELNAIEIVEDVSDGARCGQISERNEGVANVALILVIYSAAHVSTDRRQVLSKVRWAATHHADARLLLIAAALADQEPVEEEMHNLVKQAGFPQDNARVLRCRTAEEFSQTVRNHARIAVTLNSHQSHLDQRRATTQSEQEGRTK